MIPLFSAAQIKEADNYAINTLDIPGLILMENASSSIYNYSVDFFNLNPSQPIGILCGKGNNGGDGFALARHFGNKGYAVKVIYLAGDNELKGDALQNFNILNNLSSSVEQLVLIKYQTIKDLKTLNESFVIFDALLGTGSKGELRSPYKEIISEVNKFSCRKAAVDIPSGLDPDTGSGEIIFKADLTVTLAEFKRGLFFNQGKVYSGEIRKGYIGISEQFFDQAEISEYLIEPEDAVLPERKNNINKYSAGKVLVIAGSGKMAGAPVLTSNAVLRVGAGAVYLAFPSSIKTTAQAKVSEVIIHPYMDEGQEIFTDMAFEDLSERLKWMDVLAIGPGLGRADKTIDAVIKVIEQSRNKRIIIDADAVFALSNNRYKEISLKNCVLTPHTGEFANLIGISTKELGEDPLRYGRSFVEETGSYLVLKGAPSIIFNPDGEVFINSAGNNGMAKFGTGDVLTGVLAGILAQTDNIEQAIISGVYIHSLAADLLVEKSTEYGYTATDISNNLPAAIKFLKDSIV